MKLLIDIGNTRVKIALFQGKDLFSTANISECSLKIIQNFVAGHDVSSAIISSVKEISCETSRVADYYDAIFLAENTLVPVKNLYRNVEELGADRLAAVVGAYFLYPKKKVVVFDAGTCLTIDFLNDEGEYIGGRISPGIDMRYKALHNFTDKLPLIQKKKTVPIIGDDTDSSIISGVQQGILAEVGSIISEYRSRNPDTIAVITGGDCFFFETEIKSGIFAQPDLVMIGLSEILDFNV